MKNSWSLISVLSCILLLLPACSGSRQNTIPPTADMSRELVAAGKNVSQFNAKDSRDIAGAIAKTYRPWQNVSYKGKVKVDGLPIALNLKIYMVRGESVIMSLSAPLIGEVGRVEIDQSSILLVNKHSKTYCKEDLSRPLNELGATITDLQDLLMGRIFVLGSGTLTEGNAPQVEVAEGASSTWIVTPKSQPERAQYGFTVYQDGLMMLAMAGTPDESYLATAEYEYNKSDTDIDLTFKIKGKAVKLSMQLEAPNYSPSPLEPVTINSKWTRQSFRTWLKSLT